MKTDETKDRVENGEEEEDAILEGIEPKWGMDGTLHTEISIMQNVKYSEEIIESAREVYNLEILMELREQNREEYLEEGKKQITTMWHSLEALTAHTDLFTVHFLINMGNILNEIEASFETKSEYMSWLRENFGDKHFRYFQQAKQLAKMGSFARRFASIGKNRLLELDRLRKTLEKQSCEEIFKEHPLPKEISEAIVLPEHALEEHPFPDTTEDFDGELLKDHIDAIVSFYRLKNAGIDVATFDQAALMAGYGKRPVEVGTAKKLKTWLDEQSDSDKGELLERVVRDKMALPTDHQRPAKTSISLNRMLADLVEFAEEAEFDDEWVGSQEQILDRQIFAKAYRFLMELAKRMGIEVVAQ